MNQHCKFPQDKGRVVKVVQWVFSGIRGIHFINTILNLGYFLCCSEWVNPPWTTSGTFVQRPPGRRCMDNHSVAALGHRLLQRRRCCFQPSKQLFDVNLGEFLRVVYDHGAWRGYVARAIGTLIMKPIQGAEVVSPAERVVAFDSQIMHLIRRGCRAVGHDCAVCRSGLVDPGRYHDPSRVPDDIVPQQWSRRGEPVYRRPTRSL